MENNNIKTKTSKIICLIVVISLICTGTAAILVHNTNVKAAECVSVETDATETAEMCGEIETIAECTINVEEEMPEETEMTEEAEEAQNTTEPAESEEVATEHENEDVFEDNPTGNQNNGSSNNEKPNTFDRYVGRFKIPSVGVNVACYDSPSQATVDATDSAAYFYSCGHDIIADHWNQGFNGIKRCVVGTKATFKIGNETVDYTCVGKINGHNTGYDLTDANYNSIANMYPGTLVCYTCNDNWRNVTIVFFMPDEVENEEPIEVKNCDEIGKPHQWGEWEVIWYDAETNTSWRTATCKVCGWQEWDLFEEHHDEECDAPEIENTEDVENDENVDESEETIPENTEPVETEPTVTEPEETEPVETEIDEPETTQPPAEVTAETEPVVESVVDPVVDLEYVESESNFENEDE